MGDSPIQQYRLSFQLDPTHVAVKVSSMISLILCTKINQELPTLASMISRRKIVKTKRV